MEQESCHCIGVQCPGPCARLLGSPPPRESSSVVYVESAESKALATRRDVRLGTVRGGGAHVAARGQGRGKDTVVGPGSYRKAPLTA